jgi:hypothetical protein
MTLDPAKAALDEPENPELHDMQRGCFAGRASRSGC